jgi:hypothetical protein
MVQLMIDQPNTVYNKASISTSFTSDIYYTDRWTHVAVQIDVTNQSAANFSAIIQVSIDGIGWADYGTAQAITANGTYAFNVVELGFSKLRISITITAGSADFKIQTQGKQG